MKRTVFLTAALLLLIANTALARTDSNSLKVEQAGAPQGISTSSAQSPGVMSVAAPGDTVWFGGTVWDPVDARWEAIEGGTWTFDSGVGSNFDHNAPGVDPGKDPGKHALLEGWLGEDRTVNNQQRFRRLSSSDSRWGTVCVGDDVFGPGGGGQYSFWAGLTQAEADSLCYAGGQGYGDGWTMWLRQTFTFDGGDFLLEFDYLADSEPGYDITQVFINQVEVARFDGTSGPSTYSAVHNASAGGLTIDFCVSSDGAWSDEDGNRSTTCGAFVLDNVSITGVAPSVFNYSTDFETDDGGWFQLDPTGVGEYSDLIDKNDFLNANGFSFPCDCPAADTVLVFDDNGSHPLDQDNVVISPWIELGVHKDKPGKFIAFDLISDLPLQNYIFYYLNVQWSGASCGAGTGISPFTGNGFVYFRGYTCGANTLDFSSIIPAGAENVRIAFGVTNWCNIYLGQCSMMTNGSPAFDNIRLGVFGTPGAPLVLSTTVDYPQDSFPADGTLNLGSPGRVDSNNLLHVSTPTPYSIAGDTLIANAAGDNVEVQVVFSVDPGPAIEGGAAFLAWRNSHQFEYTAHGLNWYSARMDTAENNGSVVPGTWMTAYHEDDPSFQGLDTDTDPNDLRIGGLQTRLLNDMFPDNMFTPGTRLNLYYRSGFRTGGVTPSVWATFPADTSGGTFLEMEVLPSSMSADSSFNQVLYIDHNDGRGSQPVMEAALQNVFLGTSENYEKVAWDRWDVRASASLQGTFGRPDFTHYGAGLAQAKGYKAIIWDTGNLGGYSLQLYDTQLITQWLSDATTQRGLYLSGDNLASEAPTFGVDADMLEFYLGIQSVCTAVRFADCPPGTPEETIPCLGIVDSASPHFTASAPMVVQGNGCPQNRSLDVIAPNPGAVQIGGDPRDNLLWDSTGKGSHSVSNDNTTFNFKTVFDGADPAYLRDPGCEGTFAAEARLRDVLGWFDCLTDTDGDGIPDVSDSCPNEEQSPGEVDSDFDGCVEETSSLRFVKFFAPNQFPVFFETDAVGDSRITDGSEFTALAAAFANWTSVAGVRMSGGDDGTRGGPSVTSATDLRNSVSFTDPKGYLPGVLAITPTTTVERDTTINGRRFRPGEIVEFDVLFNTSQFSFSTPTAPGPPGAYDLEALATHEFGHAFGLSHTFIDYATMFYVVPQGISARTLELDDLALVRRGYADVAPPVTVEGRILRPDGATPIAGAAVFAVSVASGDILEFTPSAVDGSYKLYEITEDFTLHVHPLDGTGPLNGLSAGSINFTLGDLVETDFLPEPYDLGDSNQDFFGPGSVLTPGGSPILADITVNLDQTAPQIIATTPLNGAVGVPAATAMAVKFNERIDRQYFETNPDLSFRDMDNNIGLGGKGAITGDDSLLVFTPLGSLDYLTNYRLIIGPDIHDISGNAMAAPETLSFQTQIQPAVNLLSVSPPEAPVGGRIVVFGEGFAPDAGTDTVFFDGGVTAVAASATPDRLSLIVPQGASSGNLSVRVGGEQSINTVDITILPPKAPPTGNFLGEGALGGTPRKLSVKPGGSPVFVAHSLGISVVTTVPPDPVLPVEEIQGVSACNDVAVLPAGDRLVAVFAYQPRLRKFDISAGANYLKPVDERNLVEEPLGMALVPGGAEVVVTYTTRAVLYSTLSGSFGLELKEWSSPDYEFIGDVTVSAGGGEAYAATSDGMTAVLSLETGEDIVATLSAGPSPREVGGLPDGQSFLSVDEEGVARRYGKRGPELQLPLALGGGFRGMAISPEGSFAYLGNYVLNRIDVIDLQRATAAVAGGFPTGIDPVDIGTGNSGRYLFVATSGENRLEVYDSEAGVALTSVHPQSGGPGTILTLAGEGFSPIAAGNTVVIGGISHTPIRVGPGNASLVVSQKAAVAGGPIIVGTGGLNSNSLPYRVTNRPNGGRFGYAGSFSTSLGGITRLLRSPNGSLLFAAHGDGSLGVYNGGSGGGGSLGNSALHRERVLLSPAQTLLGAGGEMAMTPDGKKLYVADPGTQSIAVFEVDDLAPVPMQRAGSVQEGTSGNLLIAAASLAMAPDGATLYAASLGSGLVHQIPTGTDTVVSTLNLPVILNGGGVVLSGGTDARGYFGIAGASTAELVVVDLGPSTPGQILDTIVLPGPSARTERILAVPDESLVVALTATGTGSATYQLVSVNPGTGLAVSTIPLSTGPAAPGMAANHSGSRLYVADPNTARELVVDLGSFSPVAGQEVTGRSVGGRTLAISLDDARLYAADALGAEIHVTDLTPVEGIQVFSGTNQLGVSGEPLSAPLAARLLTTSSRKLLRGSPVTYSTNSDGNFGFGDAYAYVTADDQGVVRARYIPGTLAGSDTVTILSAAGAVLATIPVLGDTASLPPSIVSVAPNSGATTLPGVNTSVAADFSKSIKTSTVTTSSFLVRPVGGTTLAGTFSFASGYKRVVFKPSALAYDTEYEFVLTAGIEDNGGLALANPDTFTFRTSLPPPPTLAAIDPPAAKAGDQVVLSGVGFSSTKSLNTIVFQGSTTLPTTADPGALVTVVPTGAVTGAVQVTVNGVPTTNSLNFTLLVPNLNPANQVIGETEVPSSGQDIVVLPSGDRAYVTLPEANSIVPLVRVGEFLVVEEAIPVGIYPYGITASPTGDRVYVSNFFSNDVAVVITDPGHVDFHQTVAFIPAGINPTGIAPNPNDRDLYVVNFGDNTLSIIDVDTTSANSYSARSSVDTGKSSRTIAVTPDGGRIVIGTPTGLLIFESNDTSAKKTVDTGKSSRSIALSPDGGLAAILTTDDFLLLVDILAGSPTEGQAKSTVLTSKGSKTVALSPDGGHVYVIGEDFIQVFSLKVSSTPVSAVAEQSGSFYSLEPAGTIEVGENPVAFAFDPSDGEELFVVNSGDSTVTVVNVSDAPSGAVTALTAYEPDKLKLDTNAKFLTARLEFPPFVDPDSVDLSTVMLDSTLAADTKYRVPADTDSNGVFEAIIKFNRSDVALLVPPGDTAMVTITGIVGGRAFSGADTLIVRQPKIKKPKPGDVVQSGADTEIRWDPPPSGPSAGIDIFWSGDLGATWDTLAVDTEDDSTFIWSVPPIYSADNLLIVAGKNNKGKLVDYSIMYAPFTISNVTGIEELLPLRFALRPSTPNPFRSVTNLRFDLPGEEKVTLQIFAVDGSLVRTLAKDEPYPAGRHVVPWDGRNRRGQTAAEGVYFLRVIAGEHRASRKLVLIR